ncbi:HNH nuclease [Flavobacterium akiainvivens]|uniref:HNH nuclease n=1 Tax=Flavobacterium akiainvivens TaxID=1202724 RepID=A0A0N0RQF8_9FLAO|nr:HNH endonuclease [Flavobacterium akiainvivens]KOS05149.1 HNH nuclease [Flavobacterium akiainvivens]SFQ51119.1 putative restriction endonuclease [Flavobacterium akiainvivens]
MHNVILVNLTWNPFGWKNNTYINPKAGHSYARNNVGGESTNFDFNKDPDDSQIWGYAQWTHPPKKFINGGLIIFYTRNTELKKGQIVGVYGGGNIYEGGVIKEEHLHKVAHGSNIDGDKDLSLLFPIPIDANHFKSHPSERIVGQIGFTYKDHSFAEKVLRYELDEILKSGGYIEEYKKLQNVYEIYTGKKILKPFYTQDEKEQNELTVIYKNLSKEKLLDYIRDIKMDDSLLVIVKNKFYKRNNRTLALIKILRDYKCQICSTSILKKDGMKYIEAAHIKAKHKKGLETPNNIILLCPNHHKEFDLGDLIINEHTYDKINFDLNGINYELNLEY